MSFPRAKNRRFNEDVGCAPGVGHYNPKNDTKSNTIVFDKSSRFQELKGCTGSSDSVFVPPRRLIKCDLMKSSDSIHDRFNKSSTSSFGSQESLLPKKKLDCHSRNRTGSVSELQKIVDDLQSTLTQKETEISRLLEVIAKLDENKSTLEEAEELNREKLRSLEKLIMELIDIRDLKFKGNLNNASLEQLERLKSDLLELYDQFQSIMADMKISRSKVRELESLLEIETSAKENSISENSGMKSKLKDLEQKFESQGKEKEAVVEELQALKATYDEQCKETGLLNEQYKLALLDLQVKEFETQQFQNEAKEVEKVQDTLSRDLENMSQKVDSMQTELKAFQEEADRLKNELQSTRERNVELEEECKANLDEIRYLNIEVNNKSLEVECLQKEMKLNLDSYSKSLCEMNNKHKVLLVNFDSLKDQADGLKNELHDKVTLLVASNSNLKVSDENCKSLSYELSLKRQEMDKLQEQWTQALSSIKTLLSEKGNLNEICENLKLEIVFKEETINSLTTELKSKVDALMAVEGEKMKEEIAFTELSYQLGVVKYELQKAEKEKVCLLEDLLEKETQITELENIGVEIESTVTNLRNDVHQKEQEIQSWEVKWLQNNTTLKEAMNELQVKDNRLSNLEQSVVRYQGSLQESLTENASLSRQLSSAEEKLERGSTTLELLKLELATKDEQLEAAMESIRNAQRKQDHMRDEVQELAEDLQAKTAELEKLQQIHQKNKDSEKWRLLYERLEERISPFKEQLDAYTSERDALIHENDKAFKELSDLSEKYAKMMGHQNHRQKIQYLIKLKEEIIELKKENSRLRAIHTPKKDPRKPSQQSAKKVPLRSTENTPAYF